MQSPFRWLRHTPMTEPAAYRAQIERFPGDAASLGRIVQGLLVHSEWLDAYGIDPSAMPGMSRTTLPVSERLGRLTGGTKPQLQEQRTAQQREGGTCRDFALTLCSFLRVQGIPARMRCGFASYFGAGWEDHWICEYWDAETAAWLLADPQLDDVLRNKLDVSFNSFNMPREVFVTAGEAWTWCRSGQADAADFGHGDTKGLWFVGVNVIRDHLTLNGKETSSWDRWREATAEQRIVPAPELHELDRIAQNPEIEAGTPLPPWLEVVHPARQGPEALGAKL